MAYATISDLTTVGINTNALGSITPAQASSLLQEASDFADSYFRARYGTNAVPLLAWDSTITRVVARIAAYNLMLLRGLRPDGSDWNVYRQGYEDAVAWLDKVQRQQAHPKVTVATTGAPGAVQPNINSASVINLSNGATSRNRGW